MSWKRGTGTTDFELAHVQEWVELNDIALNGPDGDDGVIREWRDFRSFIRGALWIGGVLMGIPTLLLTMSALGIIHLR